MDLRMKVAAGLLLGVLSLLGTAQVALAAASSATSGISVIATPAP